MKKMKSLIAISFAALLGLGVAVGVNAKEDVKEADAITVKDDMTFYLIDNWGWGQPYFYEFNSDSDKPLAWPGTPMTDTGKTYEYSQGNSAKVWSFVADADTYSKFIIHNNSDDNHKTQDMQWSWYASLNGNAFLYTYDEGQHKNSLSITDYASFSIIVDNVETALIRNWSNTTAVEYKLASNMAFDPAKPISVERNGVDYDFSMKANINQNYNNGSKVNGNIVVHNAATTNLYLNADTEEIWVDGYVHDAAQNHDVYLLAHGFGDMYLYSYDTNSDAKRMGSYPGTKMTAFSGIGYKMSDTVYGIYKLTFNTDCSDNRIIFSDGGSVNQKEVVVSDLVSGDYTCNFHALGFPTGRTGAFEAIYRLQELVNAIPANAIEKTAQGSTCGVLQEDAADIVSEINTMTSGMSPWLLAELGNSTMYLLSAKDGSARGNYTFSEVMTALTLASSSSRIITRPTDLGNNSGALIAIVASIVTVGAIAGYFLLKKKRA